MFANLVFFTALAGIFVMTLAVAAGVALSPFLWFSLFVLIGAMAVALCRL